MIPACSATAGPCGGRVRRDRAVRPEPVSLWHGGRTAAVCPALQTETAPRRGARPRFRDRGDLSVTVTGRSPRSRNEAGLTRGHGPSAHEPDMPADLGARGVCHALSGRGASGSCWPCGAGHVKNLPGRRTDLAGSGRLARLLERGPLAGGFTPRPGSRPPCAAVVRACGRGAGTARQRRDRGGTSSAAAPRVVQLRTAGTARLGDVLQGAGTKTGLGGLLHRRQAPAGGAGALTRGERRGEVPRRPGPGQGAGRGPGPSSTPPRYHRPRPAAARPAQAHSRIRVDGVVPAPETRAATTFWSTSLRPGLGPCQIGRAHV